MVQTLLQYTTRNAQILVLDIHLGDDALGLLLNLSARQLFFGLHGLLESFDLLFGFLQLVDQLTHSAIFLDITRSSLFRAPPQRKGLLQQRTTSGTRLLCIRRSSFPQDIIGRLENLLINIDLLFTLWFSWRCTLPRATTFTDAVQSLAFLLFFPLFQYLR